jgi:DNA-binding beta-propeller fold protein YncE
MGFAWDGRSGDIRPVRGIPGASLLGDGIGATGYTSAVISPHQHLALGLTAEGKVQIIRLATGEVRDIPEILSAPSRLVFSPSGAAALAIGTGFQIITGLSKSPAVLGLSLPPDSGNPSVIAISDDGQLVFAADDSGAAQFFAPGFAPVPLGLPSPVFAASFQPGTRDVIALGRDGAVYRILGSTGDVQQVFADERIADGVAVRVSPDGARIYTANRLGTIAVLDTAASALQTVDCGCTPTVLEPLNAPGLYRINEISDRPLMLFDVSQSTPRIWFVPSAPAADSQRSAQ